MYLQIMQKNQLLEILDKMPDEISVGDLIAELYFREKVDKGLKQVEDGKVLTHKQAKKRLSKWLS